MPEPLLWVILSGLAGVAGMLRPDWWPGILAVLALLAGLPAIPVLVGALALWLVTLLARLVRDRRAAA